MSESVHSGFLRPVFASVADRAAGRLRPHQGLAIGLLIVSGLAAFEIFNFSTTEFALGDLIGSLSFGGVPWATILALAFCTIDFAGLARLFTPGDADHEPAEVWYLLGAWFLAAGMNAVLTWWGVSLALLGHQSLGSVLVGAQALQTGAPVFVAVLVLVLRVLMIGSLSLSGRRMFSVETSRRSARLRFSGPSTSPAPATPAPRAGPELDLERRRARSYATLAAMTDHLG